jgi:hypothetical protein
MSLLPDLIPLPYSNPQRWAYFVTAKALLALLLQVLVAIVVLKILLMLTCLPTKLRKPPQNLEPSVFGALLLLTMRANRHFLSAKKQAGKSLTEILWIQHRDLKPFIDLWTVRWDIQTMTVSLRLNQK